MPRGEGSKADLRSAGIAIGVTFAVVCLGALTCVATTTRTCAGCTPAAMFMPPVPPEPFIGAADAARELGWRDAARARGSYGGPLPPDGAEATRLALALLRERGYVDHTPAGNARDLPFEATLGELEGVCGVALVAGEGSAAIGAIHVRGGIASVGHVTPIDTSVAVVGVCGAATLAVGGVGRATVTVLSMPGMMATDVLASGLPADVVLAHAEAEVRLAGLGYTAADWVEAVELTATAGSGGTLFAAVPRGPASGCVLWVGVAVGAGRAESSWSGRLLFQDHATDRALTLSVACAASSGRLALYDDASPGATVYWRPFGGSPGAGPVTPGSQTAIAPRAAQLRVGTGGDPLPTAIPGG